MTKEKEGNGEVPSGSTIGEVVLARLDADAKRRAERETARAVRKAAAEAAAVPTESVEQPAAPASEVSAGNALVLTTSADDRALTIRPTVDGIMQGVTTDQEEMLAELAAIEEGQRVTQRERTRALHALRTYEREIDRIRQEAVRRNVDLQAIVMDPNVVDAVAGVRAAIAERVMAIRQLFTFPHSVDASEAQSLLALIDIYQTVHQQRVAGAVTFRMVGKAIDRAKELSPPLYVVCTREEHDQHVKNAGEFASDLQYRAIYFAKRFYVLQGNEQGYHLLHREIRALKRAAEQRADDELLLVDDILKAPIPSGLRDLLDPRKPLPEDSIEFGVIIADIAESGAAPLQLTHLSRGKPRVRRGALRLEIRLADDGQKELVVRTATEEIIWYFPPEFRKHHGIAAVIARKPAWVYQLVTFLHRAGVANLETLREQWYREHGANVERIRARRAKRDRVAVKPVVEVVNPIPDAEVVDTTVERAASTPPEASATPDTSDAT